MQERNVNVRTMSWSGEDVKTANGVEFRVLAYGHRASDMKPIVIQITDAEPWIHLLLPKEIPEGLLESTGKQIFDTLVKKLEKEDHSPTKFELSYRLPYYYYTTEEDPCMKLHFRCQEAAKHCMNLVNKYPVYINRSPYQLRAVEERISFLTKFQAEFGFRPCTWLRIPNYEMDADHADKCSNELEYQVSTSDLHKLSPQEAATMPLIRPSYLFLDYETNSHRKYAFPDPLNSQDEIFVAGLYHRVWNGKEYVEAEWAIYQHKSIDVADMKPIPGSILVKKFDEVGNPAYEVVESKERNVIIIRVEDEEALTEGVEKKILELNPDAVVGHNTHGFDYPYHRVRKGRMGIPYRNLSRLKTAKPGFDALKWSSSAYKDIDLQFPNGPGRIYYDTLLMTKRDYKEDSYGLDAMCQQKMGIGKHEWSAQQIFDSFSGSDPEALRNTLAYCNRDVICTWALFDFFNFEHAYVGLSDVMKVGIFDLFAQGQTLRSRTQIFWEVFNNGYYIFSPERIPRSIAGGLVFTPITGQHEYVILLDFEGLYPSIMRTFNISNDTVDENRKAPDDKCYRFNWEDDKGKWNTRFVVPSLRKGLIPGILTELKESREESKGAMKAAFAAGDKLGGMIHNVMQNAKKISMNSVYGALAQAGGYLGHDGAGATVTRIGRLLVQAIADEAKKLGFIIVYGDTDSIMLKRVEPYTDDEAKNLDKIASEVCKKINSKLVEICRQICEVVPEKIEIRLAVDGLFRTFLSIAPKMYCFTKWDPKDPLGINPKHWGSKGVASAKRDTCKMNRNLHKKLSVQITTLVPFEEIFETLTSELNRLLYGKLDVAEMTTIKSLSAEYKSVNYPMAIYYRHLNDLGMGVKPGERVPYVMRLKKGYKHQGELYEDPEVFIREGYEYDRMEYLNGQFAGKLDTMLHAAFPHIVPKEFVANIKKVYCINPKAFNLERALYNMMDRHVNGA